MSKYKTRSSYMFQREDSDGGDPSWFQDFVSNLEKSSTSGKSIYEEISAILGNSKSKYSSVEEAVKDMATRTGLAAMLNAKIAQVSQPEAFKAIPEMKTFIDNFVEDRPGTSVESVVHELLRIDAIKKKLPEKEDVDNSIKKYISDKILEVKNQSHAPVNDLNFGKADQSSDIVEDDPFAGCSPGGK